MARRAIKVLVWILTGLILLLALAWLFLYSPVFSSARVSLAQSVLSDQIGQPLRIDDDVRVRLGPRVIMVHVSGVVIPSIALPETDLVQLERLDFEVATAEVLNGIIDIDNLDMSGLHVVLLRNADDRTTWEKAATDTRQGETQPDEPAEQADESRPGILQFLRSRTVAFRNLDVLYKNDVSGFVFDFELAALDQTLVEDGTVAELTGDGLVNGSPFSLDGFYPENAPFSLGFGLGGTKLNLAGRDRPDLHRNGFETELTLDIAEIGEFLEIIGLKRAFEGSGHLATTLTGYPGKISTTDIDLAMSLDGGQSLSVAGEIGNVLRAQDADLRVEFDLYPEDALPRPARNLKEFRLTGIDAHIISETDGLELEKAEVSTNAFGRDIERIGPLKVRRVYRTEEDTLRLEGIDLRAGPKQDPILVAQGDVNDLLAFAGVQLDGTLSAPAALILDALDAPGAADLGRLSAEFAISDADGKIALDDLSATSVNTDLWSLDAQMSGGFAEDVIVSDLALSAEISDSAGFLNALALQPVDTGPVGLSVSSTTHGRNFDGDFSFEVADTRLDMNLNSTLKDGAAIIRGALNSDSVGVPDLRNLVAAAVQLGKLKSGVDRDVADTSTPAPEAPEEQPFILPKEEKQAQSAGDLIDAQDALRKLDLEFLIDIARLHGPKGATPVKGDIEIKDGRGRAGPIRVNYGGGYFNISAAMDLLENPDLVQITGGTGGWDFGEILQQVGVGIGASGAITGKFNLTGNRRSARAFVNSMYGNATIRIGTGRVETALLELAGLGVFPWLFSEERRQGYTTLVCAVAPLQIAGGKVTSNRIVAETRSVQLVAGGTANWRRDSIELRAEPRPVGRPLHRSAWPFDVTGRLSDPNFKLQVGGERAKAERNKYKVRADRKPCVPDALQVEPRSTQAGKN